MQPNINARRYQVLLGYTDRILRLLRRSIQFYFVREMGFSAYNLQPLEPFLD
jgi:hypothetical protein